MEKTYLKTPTQANYRILELIEQMVAVAPKGTDLGLCDLISAMYSGYFIESGGAVMPAVEAFLRQEIKDEAERAARSHHIFTKPGVEEILNLQPKSGKAKTYQVKQVRNVILRYRLADEGYDE
jgi:hypothetical protein